MKEIMSKDNSLIVSISKLKNKKERELTNSFLIEGPHLVKEAYLEHRLLMVFGTNKEELSNYKDIDTYLVSDKVLNKLSDTITPQGIIGVASIKSSDCLSDKIIMLDDVSDPGNLGTIIRTAAALGYNDIISSLDTVDYYNEKVVRASQGGIFKINLIKDELLPRIKLLKEQGYDIYVTSLQDAVDISEVKKNHKCVIIFGNEAHGVTDKVKNAATKLIKLEMKNNVESLNVAVAASIIMWEFK